MNCVALILRLFAFASAASAERRRLLACSPRGKGHRRRRPARSWTLEPGCHLPRATARTRCKKTSLSRSLVIERAMPYATSGGWLLALARFARCSGVNLAPTGFEQVWCTCCRFFRPNLGAAERSGFTRTLDLRLVAPSAPGGNGVDLCSSTAFWCSV